MRGKVLLSMANPRSVASALNASGDSFLLQGNKLRDRPGKQLLSSPLKLAESSEELNSCVAKMLSGESDGLSVEGLQAEL